MSQRVFLLPSGHEYDTMYLVINGVSQGLISKGASSAESLGCNYIPGHGNEDKILIKGFSYGGSNPVHKGSGCPIAQGHSDAFGITKVVDKSSPLLHNAMNGEALSSVELNCYRTSYSGRPEHFFTIHLKHAKVVVIDTHMGLGSIELTENIYFSYHQISIVHERCATMSKSNWQNSTSLQAQRAQMLEANDYNGYNSLYGSLDRRRIWIDEHPEYFRERLQGLATFWTVVTLPLGGVAFFKGSYGAYMWAYRNPIAVGDFITGFGNKNYWNVTNRHQNLGRFSREVFETMVK